ncbi:EAL domain-containing protein [Shewanella sp. MTB7]|uniref:EAL domain-containing protein n=1 Tax=Shewanella sp. MTB7 TaxID=2746932 RepID=UPI0022BA4524|nr:EAL domain-containing protein [Shewanella sp. MTB7]WBJ97158.1 EAL domain-containing protein [Shewanella sp. MTB7]
MMNDTNNYVEIKMALSQLQSDIINCIMTGHYEEFKILELLYHKEITALTHINYFPADNHNYITADNLLYMHLKTAIASRKIKPYIQPIVDNNKQIIGGEVLARWMGKDNLISPSYFIPLMEDMGLLVEMTASLLEQLIAAPYQYPKKTRLSINITEEVLIDETILCYINVLSASFIIILEITETSNFSYSTEIINIMHKLQLQGVKFALDDFGIGYSTLASFNQYPFDIIKIDRSFIENIVTSRKLQLTVLNIAQLCQLFNIIAVAEGVETQAQEDYLRSININHYQGYLYSLPCHFEEYLLMISTMNNLDPIPA